MRDHGELSIVRHMEVVVHHRLVGNGMQKGGDHIRFARQNQHCRSIVNVHTATKPKVGVVPNSVFEVQKRFGCDLRSEGVITVESEIGVLVDADQKRTKVGGNAIDQLRIVEV